MVFGVTERVSILNVLLGLNIQSCASRARYMFSVSALTLIPWKIYQRVWSKLPKFSAAQKEKAAPLTAPEKGVGRKGWVG